MLQVILEIMPGVHFRQYGFKYLFAVREQLVKCISVKVLVRFKIDIFAERETMQHVGAANRRQFCFVLPIAHVHRRGGVHNAQIGVLVVALAQLLTPIGQLKSLVDEQHLTALSHKTPGKVDYAVCLKVKAIEVDVQALTKPYVKVFFGILQQEGSTSHAPRAFNTYQTVTPVDGVHQRAPHRCVEMFHQIGV